MQKPLPEPQRVPVADDMATEVPLVDLLTAGWSGLLAANGLAQIESALPAWLPRQRWFGAKSRRIQSVRVLHWADLSVAQPPLQDHQRPWNQPKARSRPPSSSWRSATLRALPDIYQIPLAISMASSADAVTAERPDSVLTALASASGIAVLHDATAREDFRSMELKLIETKRIGAATSMRVLRPDAGTAAAGRR